MPLRLCRRHHRRRSADPSSYCQAITGEQNGRAMRTTKPNRQYALHARPSTLCTVILLLCVCIHRGIAFCPAAQVTKALPLSLSASTAVPSRRRTPLLLSNKVRNPSFRRNIMHAPTSISSSSSVNSSDDVQQSPRSKLRQLTGFSLTALRSTLRTATGFSLTTFRATLRAATGISLSGLISESLRRILGILSPSLRYFLQPLLIMYYVPLLTIRYWMVGPSKQYVEESWQGHEKLIEGWRKAVQAAEKANSDKYWPVHLNDDGTIVISLPPDVDDGLNLVDGIEMSVAATSNNSEAASACVS
ncbi:hypothetical protein ACHAXH_006342 [Discostella pseudostelligera]